jgi:hypothetical protein
VEFHAKPVEQEYESKASESARSAGEQRNAVVVFSDSDWEAVSHYWLIVNTRGFFYLPSEDWNNAVATAMVLSATLFASSFARARNSIGNDIQLPT